MRKIPLELLSNTTQKLLPGGELYEYSKQILGWRGYNTQTFGVSEPVPATDPATTILKLQSPPRKSVDEVLTEAGYDPENFKRVDNVPFLKRQICRSNQKAKR